MICATSLFALLLSVGKAFAAVTTSRKAPTVASMLLTGDAVKYGGIALICGAMYIFRKEETPLLTETMVDGRPAARVDLDAPKIVGGEGAAGGASEAPKAVAPPPPAAEESLPTSLPLEDSDFFASLNGRMQSLSEEKAAAEERKARGEEEDSSNGPPPSDDSSDEWGTGNTAVLEPPKPEGKGGGVFDGPPPVDFPPGFPFTDGEVKETPPPVSRVGDNAPAASEADVEMLKRMFGGQ